MRKRLLTVLLIFTVLISISVIYASADTSYNITYNMGIADSFTVENPNPDSYTGGVPVTFNNPSCDGYDFKGWYLDSDCTNEISYTTGGTRGSLILYAKWYEHSYTVNYVLTCDGIPLESDDIYNPNQSSRLTTEEIYLSSPLSGDSHYVFDGWYLDSSHTQKTERIAPLTTSDTTLYAKWVPAKYSVNYELGSVNSSSYPTVNTNPDSYSYGSAVTLSDASTDDPAYTFDGWYQDEFFTVPMTEISSSDSDISIYAKWKENEFDIKYVLADASGIEESTITNPNPEKRTATSDFVLLNPESTDRSMAFDGWFLNPGHSESSKITKIDAGFCTSVTLYAKWKPSVYTIIYNTGLVNKDKNNYKNTNPSTYEYGDSIKLSEITADGFIFNAWYTDENLTQPITEINSEAYGDITLYADVTEKTYTINYVLSFGSDINTAQIVNKNSEARTTTEAVSLEKPQTLNVNFRFDGWYLDKDFTNPVTEISAYTASNVTVYAKWLKTAVYLPVWGDCSLSGGLTAEDARLALRYAAKLESFSDLQKAVSDINCDSNVNAADARIILRLSAKLETESELMKKYSLPSIVMKDDQIFFVTGEEISTD